MRVGIVGAGAAGLTAAWLLNDEHDVTLFEKQDRLGGHAHTVEVEQAGERVGIDSGFEFFSGAMFPTFTRLLHLLDAPLRQYPMTATFYTLDNRYIALLPPLRNGRLIWSALKPGRMLDLLQFGYVLHRAGRLMQTRDTSITLERFLDGLPVTQSFKRNFMYPFLLAGWCVEPDEYRRFIAYDVLSYSYWHRPAGLSPFHWTEVVGGTRNYVKALAQTLTRASIKTSSCIWRITRPGATFLLEEADGARHEFDHLILATNAHEAYQLLAEVEGMENIRNALGQIEYFKTTIAVHGDQRLMPADSQHWSVVNIRFDGRHSTNTIWKGWKSREPIFRSWVIHGTRLPEPLYSVATYDHPKVNATYFESQKRLAQWQGRNQAWLAGMYMHDVDCHESAVVSGVNVARQLAPHSARLKQLLSGP